MDRWVGFGQGKIEEQGRRICEDSEAIENLAIAGTPRRARGTEPLGTESSVTSQAPHPPPTVGEGLGPSEPRHEATQ